MKDYKPQHCIVVKSKNLISRWLNTAITITLGISLTTIATAQDSQIAVSYSTMSEPAELTNDIDFGESGDLILKVYLRDILLTDGLFAMMNNGKIYLPLAELSALLDFPIIVDPVGRIATGWYVNPQNRFELNADTGTVSSANVSYPLSAETIIVDDFDIFVDSTALQTWFPLYFDVALGAQLLNVRSSEKLPKELARERSSRAVEKDVVFAAAKPYDIPEYRLIDWPEITIDMGSFYSAQSENTFTDYRVRAVGDFAFLNGKIGISGTQNQISDATVTLGRSNPQGMFGPLKIAAFEVGDTSQFLPGVMGSSLAGRGLRFGNTRLADRRDLDTIDLQGEQQTGFEVELYVNDRLRGVDRKSDDNIYDFQQVPLRLGQNEIRLEFYGPQGQRFTETQRSFVGSGQGRKGRLDYEVAIVEPGQRIEDLFQNSSSQESGDDETLSDIRLSSALNLSYGLSSRTSIGLTFASLAIDDENVEINDAADNSAASIGQRNQLYVNARMSTDVSGVLASGDITMDPNGHVGGQINGRTTLGAWELGVSQRLFQRGFRNTANINADNNAETNGNLPRVSTTASITRQFFQVPGGRLSYATNASYRQNQSGVSSSSIGGRVDYQTLSYNLGWSHTQTLQQTNGDSNWAGQLVARFPAGLLNQWSLSTDVGYTSSGQRFANTGSLRVSRQLAGKGSLSFTATRDLELLDTRYSASWNRQFIPFKLSTSIAGTSTEDLSVRVGIELTARRYPGRWLPAISSTGGGAAVAVLVFGDDNGNGVHDRPEPVLEGVRITRNGLMTGAATDQNGVALVTGLSNNTSVDVGILEADIKEPSLKYNGIEKGILPRPGRVPLLQVPLQRATDIEGTVTVAGDTPAPNVRMKLTPIDGSGEPLEIYTEYDGYYYLAHVPLGEYIFGPDPEQLEAAGLVAETPDRRLVLKNLEEFPPPEDFNLLRVSDLDNSTDATYAADMEAQPQVRWKEVPAVFREHHTPVEATANQEIVNKPEVRNLKPASPAQCDDC